MLYQIITLLALTGHNIGAEQTEVTGVTNHVLTTRRNAEA